MLNENIKALRRARGLSQEELAQKLSVVRQTVSKWEKGLSVPDAGMLIQLASALDVPVGALLGDAPDPEPEQDGLRAVAAKLELLNEQFARQNERRRRLWRGLAIALAVLAILSAAQGMLALIHSIRANAALEASEAILGGADTPTSIYVSSFFSQSYAWLRTAFTAILAAVGLYCTRRR